MRFALLGPFHVVDDGRPMVVGRGNERALLALLALRSNEVLSTDQIVSGLWGDFPPATARDMVRRYVGRARTRVGDRLVTEAAGYVLRTDEADVDLRRFEALRREGAQALAAGHPDEAVARLREALDLWRGDALAEFADYPFAQDASLRLDSLRRAAGEEYDAAQLALAPAERRSAPPWRWIAAAAVGAAIAAGAAVALQSTAGGHAALRSLPARSLGLVDPRSGHLERDVRLHATPVALTASAGRTWVALGKPHELVELDAAGRAILRRVGLASMPRSIAPAVGGVWVAEGANGTIARVDTAALTARKPVRLFAPTRVSLAAAGTQLWAASSQTGEAVRLDSQTGRLLSRVRRLASPIAISDGFGALWLASATHAEVQRVVRSRITTIPIGALPVDVAAGDGAVWAVTPADGRLWRIDPHARDVVASIAVGRDPTFVRAGDGAIWVASRRPGVITRVNPQLNQAVSVLRVGHPVSALGFSDGRLWVATS